MKTPLKLLVAALTLLALSTFNLQLSSAAPLGTAFTYQGRLIDGGSPATGNYDFWFKLYDAPTSGTQQGVTVTTNAMPVTNGLFCVTLDFGAGAVNGDARWLDIWVHNAAGGSWVWLSPRQPLTPAPHAIYAATAGGLSGSLPVSQVSGVVPLTQLPVAVMTNNATGVTLSGNLFGNFGGSFYGNGGGLTGLNPANLSVGTAAINISGNAATATTATTATNLIGNVSDAQLPASIARLNGTNNFTGTNTFAGAVIATNVNNVIAGVFTGNGGGLTNLNTAQFANSILTNGETGLTLGGTFSGNGAGVTNVNAAALGGLNATNFWQTGGNNAAAGQFLGSTNNQPLELWVNSRRALRIEPTANDASHSNIVNLVGGSPANYVAPGVYGSVVSGGGAAYYYGTGYSNSVSANMSFIGGGAGNSIQTNAYESFLGGGSGNSIQTNAYDSFVGGGSGNSIYYARWCCLGGGMANSIQTNASDSFLGGGSGNSIQTNASYSCLVGGSANSIQTSASDSFLGGGAWNFIQQGAYNSFLGGGLYNYIQMNSSYSFLGGGRNNSIGQNASYSCLGGGQNNTNNAPFSMVPGGDYNFAGGQNSFTAGHRAKATYPGMFVWADSYDADFDPSTYGFPNNTFDVRATGGSVWVTSTSGTMGPYFVPGDLGWRTSCDRNLKENFTPLDRQALLEKLSRMPITEWNAKAQSPDNKHLGPTAQDFHAAFGLGGGDDKGISTIDEGGVALAAIQGLNQKLNEKDAEIQDLKARLEKLEKLVSRQIGGAK